MNRTENEIFSYSIHLCKNHLIKMVKEIYQIRLLGLLDKEKSKRYHLIILAYFSYQTCLFYSGSPKKILDRESI
jgi:hypothetical protein